MSNQDPTLTEAAYDFSLYLMITVTAIMSGYTAWHFMQKENYFPGIVWSILTLLVIFQVPIWRFAFSKTD